MLHRLSTLVLILCLWLAHHALAAPVVALTSPPAGSAFTAPAAMTLTADASDPDGGIARVHFYSNGALIGSADRAPYSITWNQAAPGRYELLAKAFDHLGNIASSHAVSVTVGNPVSVALTAPAAYSKYLPPANIVLSADASDSSGGIARVDFYAGNTLIGTSTEAPYRFTWNNAPAGSHYLTAKATGHHGISQTSNGILTTVNAPPAVTLTAPAAGSTYGGPAAITVAADASDPDGGIARVQFYANGALIGSADSAPYRITWSQAAPGHYELLAKAIDHFGSVASSGTVHITVTNPVSVALTAPAAYSKYLPPASLVLSADASDSSGGIARVDFYAGNTLIGTSTEAPYSIAWNNVPTGAYYLTAKATGQHGISQTSSGVLVTVDTAPSVTLTAPADNATYAAGASITLAASAADSDGSISKVQFLSGGTPLATLTAPPYTYQWNNVAAGKYMLLAKATDNLGLVASSQAVTIHVVPNAAPAVALTVPVHRQTFIAPAQVILNAAAGDSDGSIARVEFHQDGALLAAVPDAPYSALWSEVPAGTYTLTARAIDNLGAGSVSAPVTITVADNQAPTVGLSATPAEAAAPARIVLTAQASDADGSIAKVQFHHGTTLLGETTRAPYSYTWSNVAGGSYSVTATAIDDLGKAATSAPVAVKVGDGAGQVYYIHADHLNTPRVITDQSNNVVWQWDNSDPFGNNLPTSSNGFEFNLRFPGQYFDRETNLHYNTFRDYDPSIGRYIQSDPIGLAAGPNTYAYVGGNPISYVDPLGLMKLPNDPSGLPSDWQRDNSHRNPNGERWRHPSGDYLDFHPGKPGAPGRGGKDHWHHNGGNYHYPPGDEIPDPPAPPQTPTDNSASMCGDKCQRVWKAVRDAVTGAIIFTVVLICATS